MSRIISGYLQELTKSGTKISQDTEMVCVFSEENIVEMLLGKGSLVALRTNQVWEKVSQDTEMACVFREIVCGRLQDLASILIIFLAKSPAKMLFDNKTPSPVSLAITPPPPPPPPHTHTHLDNWGRTKIKSDSPNANP